MGREDGEVSRAEEIYAEFEEWLEGLDKEDQERAFNAVVEWAKQKQRRSGQGRNRRTYNSLSHTPAPPL